MKNIDNNFLSRLLFKFPLSRPIVTGKIRKRFGDRIIFVSGGAALEPEIAAGFTDLGLTLFQGYGITETSPVISAEKHDCTRPGSVGCLLGDVEVRIDQANDDMVGEIVVRGPNVMQGYLNDPEATAQALEQGWYRTGDLGRIDADGFLYICGRVKNLIVTPNGKNVYPEEVEGEILKNSLVAEVVVHAHATGDVSEEIRAVVRPDPDALEERRITEGRGPYSEEEVGALMRTVVAEACDRLASYKRVKRVIVRNEEFPKTTTRKIRRFEMEHQEDSR